ncbi:uncharacterized protein LOC106082646 [Stomoxys calcitrans]|uniref:uncharacterized protein LOC106082646 n=1 Tax=Stomoxys calcitrans TaxID=35570 RepID=UPI0027E39771|nr:uncharacterized protein LOC106082646 [Stomoxys calcitrans]
MLPQLLKNRKLIADIEDNDFQQFHIRDIQIRFVGTEEAFMMTKCYRARLTYDFKGSTSELNFFVKKTPPLPQNVYDSINFKALFTNELQAYDKIIPSLEECGNINLKTVKFYHGELKTNSATLITEDFSCHGWKLTEGMANLSLEHTLLAMKYLAKFHAAGFALRAKDKKRFEQLTEGLMESRYANQEVHPQLLLQVQCGHERIFQACREYQKDIPEEFVKKFNALFIEMAEYGRRLVQPVEPFVTLCHGDYLRNNVAFKYGQEEEKDKPLEIMMFDLQTLRVTSPMYDVTTFLGLSTFAEVRQVHFKEIFDAYCEQLRASYEQIVRETSPDFMSHESLLKEFIRFFPNAVFTSSWFLPQLVQPLEISMAEMLTQQLTNEEIIHDCMTRGGVVTDRELAHQMKELYHLVQKYNVNIFQ